jgi:hypothetical protein
MNDDMNNEKIQDLLMTIAIIINIICCVSIYNTSIYKSQTHVDCNGTLPKNEGICKWDNHTQISCVNATQNYISFSNMSVYVEGQFLSSNTMSCSVISGGYLI